jgi:putative membrane protein
MALIVLIHVLFVSVWVAGLVLLCMLCAQRVATGDIADRRMDNLTLRMFALATTLPAVLAVLAGAWAAYESDFDGGWLPAKLGFVVLLTGLHIYIGRLVALLRDGMPHRTWYYVLVASGPMIVSVPILYLVLGKPF